ARADRAPDAHHGGTDSPVPRLRLRPPVDYLRRGLAEFHQSHQRAHGSGTDHLLVRARARTIGDGLATPQSVPVAYEDSDGRNRESFGSDGASEDPPR